MGRRTHRLAAAAAALTVLVAGPAVAATVSHGDEAIQGGLCIGPDCVVRESLATDNVRLKSPAPRLGLIGGTGAAWQLRGNEESFASANVFALRDATTGSEPLRVLGSSRDETLVVAPGGVEVRAGALVTSDGGPGAARTPVDGASLLAGLSALPLATYETTGVPGVRRIGPSGAGLATHLGLGSGGDVAATDVAGAALAALQALAPQIDALATESSGETTGTATSADEALAVPGDEVDALLERLDRLERETRSLTRDDRVLRRSAARVARGGL